MRRVLALTAIRSEYFLSRALFQAIFSVQNIKKRSANCHMLIKCRSRNRICVSVYRKSKIMIRFPFIDGFGKDQPAGETCLADPAYSIMRERCCNRSREANPPHP